MLKATYIGTVVQSPVFLTWTLYVLQILHATCAGSALCQNSSDSMNDIPSELSSPGESHFGSCIKEARLSWLSYDHGGVYDVDSTSTCRFEA